MIYKKLSIAAGGGIIDQYQQAEQEECANIFIGLGGTGISCLKEVKKQVYNRLKPDPDSGDAADCALPFPLAAFRTRAGSGAQSALLRRRADDL